MRAGAGDDAVVLGCGAPFGAAVGAAGGFTMVSDDLSRYGDEEWQLLEATRAAAVDEPLDLLDPFAPAIHRPVASRGAATVPG